MDDTAHAKSNDRPTEKYEGIVCTDMNRSILSNKYEDAESLNSDYHETTTSKGKTKEMGKDVITQETNNKLQKAKHKY